MPGRLERLESELKIARLAKRSGVSSRHRQRADRRVSRVDLRIALVEEQHEVVTASESECLANVGCIRHRALRVSGRADVESNRARQQLGLALECIEIGQMTRGTGGIEKHGLTIARQRCAEIGLVEGIDDEDRWSPGHALATRRGNRREEQCLARAADGQHLARRIDGAGDAVAPPDPSGDCLAQLVRAADLRVCAKRRAGFVEALGDEGRHDLARIADRQIDGLGVAGCYAIEQAPRACERRDDAAMSKRANPIELGHSECFLLPITAKVANSVTAPHGKRRWSER